MSIKVVLRVAPASLSSDSTAAVQQTCSNLQGYVVSAERRSVELSRSARQDSSEVQSGVDALYFDRVYPDDVSIDSVFSDGLMSLVRFAMLGHCSTMVHLGLGGKTKTQTNNSKPGFGSRSGGRSTTKEFDLKAERMKRKSNEFSSGSAACEKNLGGAVALALHAIQYLLSAEIQSECKVGVAVFISWCVIREGSIRDVLRDMYCHPSKSLRRSQSGELRPSSDVDPHIREDPPGEQAGQVSVAGLLDLELRSTTNLLETLTSALARVDSDDHSLLTVSVERGAASSRHRGCLRFFSLGLQSQLAALQPFVEALESLEVTSSRFAANPEERLLAGCMRAPHRTLLLLTAPYDFASRTADCSILRFGARVRSAARRFAAARSKQNLYDACDAPKRAEVNESTTDAETEFEESIEEQPSTCFHFRSKNSLAPAEALLTNVQRQTSGSAATANKSSMADGASKTCRTQQRPLTQAKLRRSVSQGSLHKPVIDPAVAKSRSYGTSRRVETGWPLTEVRVLAEKVKSLENMHDRLYSEADEQAAELKAHEKSLNHANANVASLESRCADLRKEADTRATELNEDVGIALKAKDRTIWELQTRIAKAEEREAFLTSEVEMATSQIASTEEQLSLAATSKLRLLDAERRRVLEMQDATNKFEDHCKRAREEGRLAGLAEGRLVERSRQSLRVGSTSAHCRRTPEHNDLSLLTCSSTSRASSAARAQSRICEEHQGNRSERCRGAVQQRLFVTGDSPSSILDGSSHESLGYSASPLLSYLPPHSTSSAASSASSASASTTAPPSSDLSPLHGVASPLPRQPAGLLKPQSAAIWELVELRAFLEARFGSLDQAVNRLGGGRESLHFTEFAKGLASIGFVEEADMECLSMSNVQGASARLWSCLVAADDRSGDGMTWQSSVEHILTVLKKAPS